jgi:hypothetical protein
MYTTVWEAVDATGDLAQALHPHRPPHLRAALARRAKQHPPSEPGGSKFLPGRWESRVTDQRGTADFPVAFERRPVAAADGRLSSLSWETLLPRVVWGPLLFSAWKCTNLS